MASHPQRTTISVRPETLEELRVEAAERGGVTYDDLLRAELELFDDD